MHKRKLEFPYPILANESDDYVGCEFTANISMEKVRFDRENLLIPVNYKVDCVDIERLIDEGKAIVCVLVTCKATAYRRIFAFAKNTYEQEIRIPKFSIADRVELICSITTTDTVAKFVSACFNQDYFKGTAFDLRKGDILAQCMMETVYLNDTELEKPLSSIFYVTYLEDVDDIKYRPSFEDEKIQIILSNETYKTYSELKEFNYGALRRFLASIVVMPSLTEAIEIIKKNENEDGEKDDVMSQLRWYKAILKKLENKEIDIATTDIPASELSNILLGDIIKDALIGMQATIDNITDKGSVTPLGGMD